tara:strand:+ start:87 stop:521 length:435 start_codon:yes stop_codon:yes gene_type:complete
MSKWDKKTFITATKDSCEAHISNIVLELVKCAEVSADLVQWGRGTGHGTMRYKCKTDDYGTLALFEITTKGQINFLLNSLRAKVRKKEILRDYQLKLESNFMLDFDEEEYTSDIYYDLDDIFTIKQEVDKFINTIQGITDRLHQ